MPGMPCRLCFALLMFMLQGTWVVAATPSAYWDGVSIWRDQVVSGKGRKVYYDGFRLALDQKTGPGIGALANLMARCERDKEWACVGWSAYVLGREAEMLKALQLLQKQASRDKGLLLAMALLRIRLSEAKVSADPKKAAQWAALALKALPPRKYPMEAGQAATVQAMAAYLVSDAKGGDQWLEKSRAWLGKAGNQPGPRVLEMGGRTALRTGNNERALELLSQARTMLLNSKAYADEARVLSVMGSLYARMGRPEQALAALDKAESALKKAGVTSEAMADLHLRRGRIWLDQKQTAKAKSAFQQARSLFLNASQKEEAAQALYLIAETDFAAGNMVAAVLSYERLLQEFPKGAAVRVYLNYAQALADSGKCTEALTAVKKGQEKLKDEKNTDLESILLLRVTKGRCLKSEGKTVEASKELGEVQQLATTLKMDRLIKKIGVYATGLKLAPALPAIPPMNLSGAAALPFSPSQLLSSSAVLSASRGVFSPAPAVAPPVLSP